MKAQTQLFRWHGRTQYAETRMREPVALLIKLLFGFPVRFGKTVTEEARQGAIQLPLTASRRLLVYPCE
jgi:hypothetical protein